MVDIVAEAADIDVGVDATIDSVAMVWLAWVVVIGCEIFFASHAVKVRLVKVRAVKAVTAVFVKFIT